MATTVADNSSVTDAIVSLQIGALKDLLSTKSPIVQQ